MALAKTKKSIEYGDGNISISMGDNVTGFDIRLRGKYILESYNPPNFLMMYKNDRILGVGLGSKLGTSPFIKYTGNLEITRCKVITGDMEQFTLRPLIEKDKFNLLKEKFTGINTKIEDLNKDGTVMGTVMKSEAKFITENLKTRGGEYILNGADYIGDMHIHSNGDAMTGATHDDDSKKLKSTSISKQRMSKTIKTISALRGSSSASSGAGGGGY